jgi:hypothetical protein
MAMVGTAMVAHSFPRNSQSRTTDNSATPAAVTAGSTSAAVVIASGFEARSVAIPADAAAPEPTRQSTLYVTAADQPNRIFSLNTLGSTASAGSASTNPNLVPIAGIGASGSLGDGGMAAAAEFSLKLDSLSMRSGVAVAADGTIFVADTRNATIRRIAGPASSEPGVVRSIVGRWAPRQSVELAEPMGIALDRAGNLYIADHGANSVLILRGATMQSAGALEMLAHVSLPASVAVTGDGSKVFVASPENGGVFAIAPRTHSIQSVAGFMAQASACPASAPTTRSPGAACPAGLAVDGGGNIFVADSIANHITRVDAQSSRVTIAAGNLLAPGDVSFDANGNLFIVEQGRESLDEIHGLGMPANSVTLMPASQDFGVEPLDGISPSIPFTLMNSTNAALTGLNVSTFQGMNAGDFQTASTSCLLTLPANSSCLVNVALSPVDQGALSAQLAVTYTGAVNPVTANATGTGAEYTFAPAGTQQPIAVVTAGNSATYNLVITPDTNFPVNSPFTISFVCPPIENPTTNILTPGDLQAFTTCTFMPPNPTIIPGTALPVTFVVMTTSQKTGVLGSAPAVGSGSRTHHRRGASRFPALGIIIAAALLLIFAAIYGRGEKKIRIVSIVAVFFAVAALVDGCGGGGARIIGTPSGTANFVVQATVQNAQGISLNVTRAVALQLIVQNTP